MAVIWVGHSSQLRQQNISTTADLTENHSPDQSGTGSLSNILVHPTFSRHNPGPCPGTVEVIVGTTSFFVHKQVMIHASPFFESILTGEWAETTNPSTELEEQQQEEDRVKQTPHLDQPASSDSIHPIRPKPQTPSRHRPTTTNDELDSHFTTSSDQSSATTPLNDDEPTDITLASTLSSSSRPLFQPTPSSSSPRPLAEASACLRTPVPHSTAPQIEARIYLKEERAASFQDLLMFVYPHLEVSLSSLSLMTMSQKFDMPLLQRHVLNFLLSSVAGKPIEAMKIAEEHQLPELYRESSRFLLDNWQGWDHKELESLSSATLLKLEKRRTWFLERLLKLGLVNSSRDYVCPPSCLDPQHCTKLVDDKWRSAWAASFKFGPPQVSSKSRVNFVSLAPSSVYRALRCLEPSLHSPALLLPHTSCQQHALRFFADLFDRMFSQFAPRGGGGGGAPNGNSNSMGGSGITMSHSASASYAANSLLAAGTSNPLDQQQQQQQPSNLAQSLPVSSVAPTTTLPGFSSLNIGGISSNFLNSDKSIRKAKYFLHVELFESSEKPRKRLD
ncbi:uncharacterized protein VP01_1089g9 [Puccinia sorghi]|uniref:BTB domain-containing protein n=1 Tax=Puccinia sorghi TaxID=27349 RepID=A0A0L6VUJ1_9BASI|nr:uncharacterized protein VP01_1089g9 [Puccinia sorghi]